MFILGSSASVDSSDCTLQLIANNTIQYSVHGVAQHYIISTMRKPVARGYLYSLPKSCTSSSPPLSGPPASALARYC